nr:hypothetical protein Iba_chr09fCG11870 [Ipomoea batatas]
MCTHRNPFLANGDKVHQLTALETYPFGQGDRKNQHLTGCRAPTENSLGTAPIQFDIQSWRPLPLFSLGKLKKFWTPYKHQHFSATWFCLLNRLLLFDFVLDLLALGVLNEVRKLLQPSAEPSLPIIPISTPIHYEVPEPNVSEYSPIQESGECPANFSPVPSQENIQMTNEVSQDPDCVSQEATVTTTYRHPQPISMHALLLPVEPPAPTIKKELHHHEDNGEAADFMSEEQSQTSEGRSHGGVADLMLESTSKCSGEWQ